MGVFYDLMQAVYLRNGENVILYRYLRMNLAFLERLGKYEQAEACMDELAEEIRNQSGG